MVEVEGKESISNYMSRNVVVCYLPGTRDEILRIMARYKKTGLPVIRRDNHKYIGLITRLDIFNDSSVTQPALLVKKVSTVSPDTSVEDTARVMVEKNQSHMPIIEDDKVVGIVTPTDIFTTIIQRKIMKSAEHYLHTITVPVYEKTPLSVVLETFSLTKIYALPVLDYDIRLVGIITDRDVFKTEIIREYVDVTTLGLGDDEEVWSWQGLHNIMKLYYQESKIEIPETLTVADVMTRDVKFVRLKTPIYVCASIMQKYDFCQLPVLDKKDKLCGMIYQLDVLRSLYE